MTEAQACCRRLGCGLQPLSLGTWLGCGLQGRTVAYGDGGVLGIRCLAASGSALVSGSMMASGGVPAEVRVWGLEELDLRNLLRQPAGSRATALLGLDGEVWAWTLSCGGDSCESGP